MTSVDWSILVPAIVGCLGALAAWLRGEANKNATNARLSKLEKQ